MWDGLFPLIRGCHSPVGVRVFSPVVGVEAPRVGLIKLHCHWVHALSLRKWQLKQVKHMQIQWTYVPSMRASTVPPRSNTRSHPILLCVHPKPTARLRLGMRHNGYRNQGGYAAAWDLDCLCGKLLPGPVCHRTNTKLWCGVDGSGVLPLGNDSPHSPTQDLSTRDTPLTCASLQWAPWLELPLLCAHWWAS